MKPTFDRHIATPHNHIPAAAAAAAVLAASFASCSDDKELPLPQLEEKTFTGAGALHLTYDGYDMPGKSVTVRPSSDGNAELTLFGEFDLSQLSLKGVSGKIPTPGVLPGEVKTVLPVALSSGNGFRVFSGKATSGAVDFSYAGKIYGDSLVMAITDARLTNLSGALGDTAWQLTPLVKADSGIGYKSMPFHVLWECDPVQGIDIPLTELLSLAVTVPCIPVYHDTAYSSVAQLIGQIIQTVKFQPDGNIWVNYMSNVGGATHLTSLNPTTIQYSPAGTEYLRLYVNPLSVAGLAMTTGALNDIKLPADSESEALMPLVKRLIAELAPQLASGLQIAYRIDGDNLAIFFNQATAAPLLETIFNTIISDPDIMQALMAEIQKYPALAENLPEVIQALQQLPSYLEKTTRFEFGLSLKRIKS